MTFALPRPSTRRRTGLLLALPLVLAGALSGCEKPTPSVTVESGGASDHVEALCWNDHDAPAPDDCGNSLTAAKLAKRQGAIPIKVGETIGISVDRAIADAGWQVNVGNRSLARDLDSRYYKIGPLTLADLSSGTLDLRVYAYAGGSSSKARGLWVFALKPA